MGARRTATNPTRTRRRAGPNRQGVSPGLVAVRQRAQERKLEKFTNLLHPVTIDLLRTSYYALQWKAPPGVDGVTWKEYETGLDGRLVGLHSRVHRGAYRAQPSRRIYLPKPDGRQRPISIAALEDKIVQQAVVTVLNEIYEVDFRGFSSVSVRDGMLTRRLTTFVPVKKSAVKKSAVKKSAVKRSVPTYIAGSCYSRTRTGLPTIRDEHPGEEKLIPSFRCQYGFSDTAFVSGTSGSGGFRQSSHGFENKDPC